MTNDIISFTDESLAKAVPERIKEQYFDEFTKKWYNTKHFNSEYVYNLLMTLEEDLTKSIVDKIIGNESWTTRFCYSCNNEVLFGTTFSGQSGNINLCQNCLQTSNNKYNDEMEMILKEKLNST